MTSKKKALLFEPCPYHFTLLSCYIYYLNELNYDITLLVHESFNECDELARLGSISVSVVKFCDVYLQDVPTILDFNEYDLVFVSTLNLSESLGYANPFEAMGFYPNPVDGLFGVIHSKGLVDKINLDYTKFNQVFSLVDFGINEPSIKPLTLFYYGENDFKQLKRDSLSFAIVGGSVSLANSVKAALHVRRKNKIKITGVGAMLKKSTWIRAWCINFLYPFIKPKGKRWLGIAPKNIISFLHAVSMFNMMGFAKSSLLYKVVENSSYLIVDFNEDLFRIFSQDQMSGQALLSLGFRKPMVLPQSVAEFWGFNDENSVIFPDGHLEIGLETAIALPEDEYKKMQEALVEKAQKESAASLGFFRDCLKA